MGILKNKMDKRFSLINFMLLVFLFEPNILVKYPIYNTIFILGGILSFLNIFIIYIKKNIKFNKMMIFFILFMALNVVTTVIYKGDILKIGYIAIVTVTLFLYAKYYYDTNNIDVFFYMLYKIFSIYLCLNLVLYLLYPSGINENFSRNVFFRNKN